MFTETAEHSLDLQRDLTGNETQKDMFIRQPSGTGEGECSKYRNAGSDDLSVNGCELRGMPLLPIIL
jgi:hypothetical protein